RSSSSSEIRLNKMNVAQGSVVVTAGGMKLAENVDYTVDYLMGTVKIINQGLLESGTPIKISLEDQATFRMQSKSMLGTHLEYAFNRDFNIGATILHLRERPLTNKVDLQNIPVANTIWGFNSNYRSEVPWLTRAIDWLPLIETKAKSTINFSGEFAYLIPGHSRLINNPYDKEGQALLDDFEGSETSYTLKQRQNWVLASTPLGQPDLFPEAELSNNLAYGYNRAKLAWYHIDPLFLRNNSATPSYIANNPAEQSSHFVREIQEQEIFPYKESPNNIPTYIQVLNLAYYPQERGPYNYDAGGSKYSAGVNADGKLRAPQSRWAGIMSKLQTNDFEAANVEYLEFWLMDPYVEDEKNNTVRDDRDPSIFFDLGNISEDVLKDGRKAFENGLPTSDDLSKAYIDTTVWGRVPAVQSFVNAFDNDVQARKYQDIGLDGLSDENERTFFAGFLDSLQQIVNPASQAYLSLLDDPSSDDFHYFRGDDYDQEQLGILDRYKKYNGLDGNSPTPDQTAYPTQSSNLPDVEDINHDNTLSESESYYQYKVSLRKEDFVVGRNYITDAIVGKNDQGEPVTWYQFKVPIYEPQKVIGGIQDFKSIRFIRMFLTGFGEPVILRLASLDLVRGEWRKYNLSLLEGAEQLSTPESTRGKFEIFSVNIEENGNRYPVNYVLPPGIARITDPNNPQMIQKNEQSIAFKVTDLEDGDARAAYINKSIDMRQFKRLRLFTHAEAINEDELQNGDLRAFIRVGSDYTQNYYEYEIPLVLTPHLKPPAKYQADLTGRELVWPDVNEFNIELKIFQQVKQLRNDEIRKTDSHVTLENIFEMYDGNNRVSVVGNPNLSNVKTIMIGVRNPSQANNLQPDDGLPKSGIIWMNELRLTEFDESGGWAANARMNVKLADLGSLSVATGGSVPGFGSIDKKVQQRSREEIFNYDVSSSLQLGRLFPQKAGVNLPVFVGLSEMKRNPQYNPLDPDIPLQAALDNAESREERDSIIYISQDYTRRRSINITNVRIDPKTKSRREPKIYDIGNWSVSYSYSEALSRNIKTEQNLNRNYNMVLSYIYNDNNSKPWEPFKKSTALNKPAFRLIRDFNLFYKPSMMRFQTNLQRQYNEIKFRNISNPYLKIDPTYNKNFYWNRLYDFKWDLSRNLKLDFSAQNVARVDEPDGSMNRDEPDFKQKRDSIWDNLLAFGRTTKYHHTINAQYNIPINKIPLFDWIQSANLTYRTDFDWSAGPITPDTIILGNTVQNNSTLQMNGSLSLQKLYNKVGFLKKIDDKFKRRASGGAKKQTQTVTFTAKNISLKANKPKLIIHDLMTEDVTAVFYDQTQRVVNVKTEIVNNRRIRITADKDVPGGRIEVTGNAEVKQNPLIFIAENTAHLLMGIKSVSVNYSTDAGTMLPGFLPVAQWLGMRSVDGTMAPGWGFIMGRHDSAFGDYAAAQGWLTTDSTLNQAYMDQSRNSLQFRASIEPVSDLRIEVTASRAMSQNVEQFYIYHEDGFSAENTMFTGNFSMSFFSLKTAFENPDANNNYASASWEQFKNNRVVISKRLGQRMLNGQVSGSRFYDPNNGDVPGYADGFGPTSQEVLIPAFLAAYSGKDAGNISLNPMPGILSMMPNWRIDYRGLQRTDWAKRIFKNLSISHSYRSTYSVGSFTTNLYWDPDEVDGLNYIRDLQFNFLPEREIGGISISEQMSPLISLDAQLQNSFMLRIEIVKSRNMTLSLNNNQLMENRSDEFRLGGGYRFQQVPISIKAGGTKRSFQSDLDLRLDLSIRDNRMIMRKLEEDVDKLTSGQRAITLKFTADYVLSSRFNLRFFYDQVINHPFVTLSYPTSNTKIGFNLRFTLTN
ncbi:MAG: cell surface protein SprA, partial [Bacteroidales bacterium]|nr:cell surface protein SprA [Bacteroidales bacterium]